MQYSFILLLALAAYEIGALPTGAKTDVSSEADTTSNFGLATKHASASTGSGAGTSNVDSALPSVEDGYVPIDGFVRIDRQRSSQGTAGTLPSSVTHLSPRGLGARSNDVSSSVSSFSNGGTDEKSESATSDGDDDVKTVKGKSGFGAIGTGPNDVDSHVSTFSDGGVVSQHKSSTNVGKRSNDVSSSASTFSNGGTQSESTTNDNGVKTEHHGTASIPDDFEQMISGKGPNDVDSHVSTFSDGGVVSQHKSSTNKRSNDVSSQASTFSNGGTQSESMTNDNGVKTEHHSGSGHGTAGNVPEDLEAGLLSGKGVVHKHEESHGDGNVESSASTVSDPEIHI